MKIVNIVPGFGGTFYCGNCLRDSVFVKTLKTMGHDAMLLPIYLPLTSNDNSQGNDTPVFYGAVNIYLKQKFGFLHHMPQWLHRFFDSKPILRYAAKKAGSTRADGLEAMTISMLRGSDGFQAEELQQLIDFLKHHEKPDVVHLSNALLLGLAEKIHTDLQIPVVCSLQDEDVWVDAMEPQFRDQVWQLMAEKGKFVDSFVAVSDFYAGIMKKNMNIPDHKMNIVHIGVNPENYTVHTPSIHPPVIGYLSRLCDENGLEVLVDAFIELKDTSTFKTAKLRITGGKTADDKPFINKQLKKLKKKEYLNDVEFIDDFRTEALSDFFRGLTVLSVPVLKGEAFGLYQLESLASGIPVVQPALGAFPEIAEVTGGGVIYHPNSPQALSAALESLFSTPEKITLMSEKGRQAVKDLFNSEALAGKMVQVYENAKAKKFQHAT
jgi:glycosyltransferase involved in cell wall biosynthesis